MENNFAPPASVSEPSGHERPVAKHGALRNLHGNEPGGRVFLPRPHQILGEPEAVIHPEVVPTVPLEAVRAAPERLVEMVIAAFPELQGKLIAVA